MSDPTTHSEEQDEKLGVVHENLQGWIPPLASDDEDLGHVVLLVPCNEDPGDCVNVLAASSEASQALSVFAQTHVGRQRTMCEAMRRWRERFTPQHQTTIGSER